MSMPEEFGFISASTTDERMSALEDFIVFWLGPRLEKHGESESRLDGYFLPKPLRRLQEFAGCWTCRPPYLDQDVPILAILDRLRTLEQLELSDDGKLIFLDDHQGQAVAATLPQGEDPPVWVSEWMEPNGPESWTRLSASLSETLVSVVLRQLFHCSRFCLADTLIDRWLHSSRSEVVSIWSECASAFSKSPTRYSLWEGAVLVQESGSLISYAANHDDGIAFLREHQGEIERLLIGLQGLVTLRIETDGSAEVDFVDVLNASGHVPPGTFDFAEERDRLLALSDASIQESLPWYVMFPRTGQSSCRSEGIRDVDHAGSLLKKAIKSVTFQSMDFDEHLKRLPSLSP